jgi:hypothetical protein
MHDGNSRTSYFKHRTFKKGDPSVCGQKNTFHIEKKHFVKLKCVIETKNSLAIICLCKIFI